MPTLTALRSQQLFELLDGLTGFNLFCSTKTNRSEARVDAEVDPARVGPAREPSVYIKVILS